MSAKTTRKCSVCRKPLSPTDHQFLYFTAASKTVYCPECHAKEEEADATHVPAADKITLDEFFNTMEI